MAIRTIVSVFVLLARKVEPMASHKGTFHQWYYGPYQNDELNLIWAGWFLWITDWTFEQTKIRITLKG
jgi:hypothetical protein